MFMGNIICGSIFLPDYQKADGNTSLERCTCARRLGWCVGLILGPQQISLFREEAAMGLILLIIVLVLLFGGGGGYYAHQNYGPAGLSGVLGTVLIICLIIWLLGGRL